MVMPEHLPTPLPSVSDERKMVIGNGSAVDPLNGRKLPYIRRPFHCSEHTFGLP